MKTAISVPDPIFREAEKLARRLKKSRSRLYSEAMAEYLRRHDPDALAQAVEQFYDSIEDRPDPFVQEAARRTLAKSEW
jgi:predicted transcriptional regulator